MSIDSLYADLGVDFQLEDRQAYLEELAYVARYYKTSLGSGEQEEKRNVQLQTIEEIAANFKQEVVEFAFRQVVPLEETLFNKLNLETPPYIDYLLQRFNFFKVDFPITLRSHWGFTRLKCSVEFNPDDRQAERPVAFQIFPDQEWQEVFHAWQSLAIGLDANLEFKLAPQLLETLSELQPSLKTTLEPKIASKTGLIVGPFDYYIRRPKIKTTGRDYYKVWWDLEGKDQITQTEPRLGVVLKVPKNTTRVDVKGELLAIRPFTSFTILHDLWDLISTPAQNYFKSGAPVPAKKTFEDITAGI